LEGISVGCQDGILQTWFFSGDRLISFINGNFNFNRNCKYIKKKIILRKFILIVGIELVKKYN
jgi:hypothetical protein